MVTGLLQHSNTYDGFSCNSFTAIGRVLWLPCQPMSHKYHHQWGLFSLPWRFWIILCGENWWYSKGLLGSIAATGSFSELIVFFPPFFLLLFFFFFPVWWGICFLLTTRTLKLTHTWICFFFLGIQTFKWQDYISWQKKLNEARASAAALKAGVSGMRIEGEPPKSKWRSFFRKSTAENVQVTKNNIYDKGFFHNLLEIIFPLSMRSSFLQTKSKSGWNFH